MRIQVNKSFGLQIDGKIKKFTAGVHELDQAEATHWYTQAALKEGWAVKLEAEQPPVEPPVTPPVPPAAPPASEPPSSGAEPDKEAEAEASQEREAAASDQPKNDDQPKTDNKPKAGKAKK